MRKTAGESGICAGEGDTMGKLIIGNVALDNQVSSPTFRATRISI